MNGAAVAARVPVSSAPLGALGRRATVGGRQRTTRMAQAWMGATDVGLMLGIAFAIPFVVLAVGVPIALIVQLLLWLVRLV